jgi:hypothetical protein
MASMTEVGASYLWVVALPIREEWLSAVAFFFFFKYIYIKKEEKRTEKNKREQDVFN